MISPLATAASFFTDPDVILFGGLSALGPLAELTNATPADWPWYATFLYALLVLVIGVLKIYWRHQQQLKKEERDHELKMKRLENKNKE